MSFSIDQKKIDAELAKTPPAYTVTPCNLEIPSVSYELPTVNVNSAVTAMPPGLERARERFLILRQRIIDRGSSPLSNDELDREIDETRGRS